MKRYLLPKEGNFYKANLHCHTNLSDGKWSPEQMKEEYMKKGYSIIAYTDHDIFIPHPELKSDDFLPLNAFEVEIHEKIEGVRYNKTCHICFVALDSEIDVQPMWNEDEVPKYSKPNIDKVKFDKNAPKYVREYTPECVNDMMRIGKEAGFFVTYNHPKWSQEGYEQYIKYENMDAMEICNYASYAAGYFDYNPEVYDAMLRSGKRIFCTSTDDNHDAYPSDDIRCDSFGGYVMIKAEKLEYNIIGKALKNGDFYSSRGPEISELWFDDEDNTVHIKCGSSTRRITYNTGTRSNKSVYGDEAVFKVDKTDTYFRITVFDEKNLTADTNAYFVDELIKK